MLHRRNAGVGSLDVNLMCSLSVAKEVKRVMDNSVCWDSDIRSFFCPILFAVDTFLAQNVPFVIEILKM